ncbi:RNA polymerase sigma factor [Erysipelothrix sp. HDW6C]|uniref:RNA polymerase sigma factor n=1 Tax=Erysipelothrix sp. HDW6C TaxID=2714930 RepID=UPI00140DA0BC|nr:RNA polymerase sigma factor [Erysipelothrix sp. HDW6C]QIK69602.1 RNA polymerase sigma factor [Erysipelothrix sp. HDW6C]
MEITKKTIRDRDELARYLKTISKELQAVAYSFMGDTVLVDDVISETVVKVFNSRKKVKHPEFFKTWIIRILINTCKDTLIAQNKYVELFDEDLILSTENSNDAYAYVHDYVDELPFIEREVITLKVFSGYTFKEISEIIEVPEGTAKTRYYAGLKRLKLEMEELSYE